MKMQFQAIALALTAAAALAGCQTTTAAGNFTPAAAPVTQAALPLQAYQPGNAIYAAPFAEHAWFEAIGVTLTPPASRGFELPSVNGRSYAVTYRDQSRGVRFMSGEVTTRGGVTVSVWVDENVNPNDAQFGLITWGVGIGQDRGGSWHGFYDYWTTSQSSVIVGQHPHCHIASPNHSDAQC